MTSNELPDLEMRDTSRCYNIKNENKENRGIERNPSVSKRIYIICTFPLSSKVVLFKTRKLKIFCLAIPFTLVEQYALKCKGECFTFGYKYVL